MSIDWFTVTAQAVNFLILVWLMKHFLYKPVLHAIDEREKRVATELADANAKQAAAQKERDALKEKNEEFDRQRAKLLKEATEAAQAERDRMLDDARKDAAASSLKRDEALRSEAQSLHDAIGHRMQEQVLAVARKVLKDLAGTSLEESMIDLFLRRLRELSKEEVSQLTAAFKTSSSPICVRTTSDLSAEQRAAIQGGMKEIFGGQTQVKFETTPNLISGIELSVGGRKLAWSISNYLASLASGYDELTKDKVEIKDPPKPESVKRRPEMRANEQGL